jgi:hypothetical protein
MLADDTVPAMEFEAQIQHAAAPCARSQNMFGDSDISYSPTEATFPMDQRAN